METETSPAKSIESLVNADGTVNIDALSRGMFILRFTPDKQLVTTWISNDRTEEIQSTTFRLDAPPIGDEAGEDWTSYIACMASKPCQSIDDVFKAMMACGQYLLM
jgi:hypothetical protein